MDTDDEEVFLHFSDAFICSGRVTNIKRLMSFHPLYLDSFMNTESYLMDGEGPLPFDWRYYIGILVSFSGIVVVFCLLNQGSFTANPRIYEPTK